MAEAFPSSPQYKSAGASDPMRCSLDQVVRGAEPEIVSGAEHVQSEFFCVDLYVFTDGRARQSCLVDLVSTLLSGR